MQCDPAINSALNAVLKEALTLINQTFLHARMLDNWGLRGLGQRCYKVSIEAMKQSDVMIKRILFLEGLPNLQSLGHLHIGEDPKEIIGCDLGAMQDYRSVIVETVSLCESKQDYQSREHLEELLEEAEEYIDFLETQLALIKDMGLENYLQSQMEKGD